MELTGRPTATEHEEVRALLRERLDEMEALSREDLAHYGHRTETIRTCSDAAYRLVSVARCYTVKWGARIEIEVWVYPEQGWRRWAPYFESLAWDDLNKPV